MSNLLYQNLTNADSNATAFIYMNKSFSYKTLTLYADKIASSLLKCGLKKGEVVTVALPNIPEAAYLFYGINKAGGVAHMSHPLLPRNQMHAQMTLTNSRFLFCLQNRVDEYYGAVRSLKAKLVYVSAAGSLGKLKNTLFCLKTKQKTPKNLDGFYDFIKISGIEKVASVGFDPHILSDNETSILLNSGGTGGQPKTVELSSFALQALCKGSKKLMWRDDLKGAFMLSVLPFFHGFGLAIGLNLMIMHGGCNVLMPRFNRDATLQYLKKGKINYIVGVPTLYNSLLAHKDFSGDRLKNIETAFVGGDLVPQKLIDDFNLRLRENGSGGILFEGYGLTEAVTVATCNTHKSFRTRSVGKPIEGVYIKAMKTKVSAEIVELEPNDNNTYGELCIGGDTLMNGYYKDEEATAATFTTDADGNRLLLTGDYGYVDSDGFVFFKQRLKRVLKVGGVTVFPAEIEQVACTITGVDTVCAVGVDDERKGTKIILAIETKASDRELLKQTLFSALTQNLNTDSIPKEIVFFDSFPLTQMNKIDVNALKERFLAL